MRARALMHREERADAVAGAMVEIEAGLPERTAREGIDAGAGDALREDGRRDRDMALQHARETVAHLLGRRADGYCAGDIGRAVLILRAGMTRKMPGVIFRLEAALTR